MPADRSHISRRSFLLAGAAAAAAACSGSDSSPAEQLGAAPTEPPQAPTSPPAPSSPPEPTPSPTPTPVPVPDPPASTIESSPFTLGVASGDPTESSVILWTMLLTDAAATPVPETPHEILWEVARDEDFASPAAAGLATARPELGHAVHVDADGLAPDTAYWYRFRIGSWVSPTGRTRTFPEATASPDRLRFGFSSCQHIQLGYYAAHRHLSTEGLDVFVWLGDYIYEGRPRDDAVDPGRRHTGDSAMTLTDYRERYRQYKRDPDLQANHAAHPWIITWDDHEVANNYGADRAGNLEASAAFLERRAAAYQAWYEHLPVRVAPPDGADMPIHRSTQWGDLAHLFALDTRQHRDPGPTDGVFVPFGDLTNSSLPVRTLSEGALDPARSMLGADQEEWLVRSVEAGDATWAVLAQSIPMQGFVLQPADPPLVIVDGWDGYAGNRRALLERLAAADGPNLVSLAGDLHVSIAGDVRADPFDPDSPVLAAEFVSSSISSTVGRITRNATADALLNNPHMRHLDVRRGYVVCDVTPARFSATFMAVDDGLDPSSPVREIARHHIDAGVPGLV